LKNPSSKIRSLLFLLLSVTIYSCSTETKPTYTLEVSAEPAEAGIVEQSATEAVEGESISITAKPNEFWVFTGWAGDISGTSQPSVNVYMDMDRSITALFEKVEFPVTVNIMGEGNVVQEVISQKSVTTDYPHATVLKLTAEPDHGWEFVNWSGDIERSEQEIEIEVDGPIELTATFKRIDFKLTVSIEGEGEVKQEIVQAKVIENEYPFETTVQLTAVPAYGWEFVGWGADADGSDPVLLVNISEEKSVTATFERTDFTLSTETTGEGSIQITANGDQPSGSSYPFETTVELTATPAAGWNFAGWSGDATGSDPTIQINMDSDKHIVANFTIQSFTVTVQVNGNGSVLQNGVQSVSKEFPYGSKVELQAIAADGWVFSGWSGALQSNFNPVSVLVEQDQTLTLNFTQLPATLRILPLGDSITNGFPDTYRYSLFHTLRDSGFNFYYVGSQNTNPANYPGSWDTKHEGHNGASTRGIDLVLETELNHYTADIALIHLGTNDVSYSIRFPSDFSFSTKYLEAIINKLRADNPVVRIYLAKILPFGDEIGTPIETFKERRLDWNNKIQDLAAAMNTSVSPIYIVDMDSGFDESDLIDGIHPNLTGAEKMAQRWYEALSNN